MKARIRQYGQQLRESLWFVPGLLVLTGLGLAYGLVEFDAHTNWQGQQRFPLLFGNGADGARGMLSAIAGSMLTVATLTFSLTLSTISQVSSQYSPRVLRNFMRDRVNQVVMGYFVGVFTYCLIVLGTIRSTQEGRFVPATAVLGGLLLSLGGVAALIFFIHHIAESLQTGTILRNIFRETQQAIDHLFPDRVGQPLHDPDQIEAGQRLINEPGGWQSIACQQTGYLQQINPDGLLQWATRHRVVLRIDQTVGAFVGEGSNLFSIRSSPERPEPLPTDWPDDLRQYVSIGKHRNIDQDATFGVQQLVDITLKALSPGINDTTTAIMAIDYLGAIGEQLARHSFPAHLRSDGQHLRIIVRAAAFDDYIRLAFDLPRINAKGNHAVMLRLLRALALVGAANHSAGHQAVLKQQLSLLLTSAQQTLATDYEKQTVQQLHKQLAEEGAFSVHADLDPPVF